MSATVSVQEHVYTAALQITGENHFGISMQTAMSGAEAIPPEGVRIDIPFVGQIKGKINGETSGTDYIHMRGDGITILHVHATITTDSGEHIALFADGVATLVQGSPKVKLAENVTLHTAAAEYAWMNRVQFWATGETDLSTGQITLEGYAA